MIYVNKIILLLILLLAVNNIAQNSFQYQFDKATQLFNQEKYFDAITELKRLQYFDKQNQYSFQSNLLIGKSYKAGAKYDEAVKYFTLAEINSSNQYDYYTSKILNARTNILRRTNNQANKILFDLENDVRFDSLKNEIKYWQGWNHIFSNQWEEAYNIFSIYNQDSTLNNLCKSVCDDLYNESFAKYSSYIIPGFGQFYTGEYLSGTLSLAWNTLFGFLTINALVEDRVFDGIVIGNFLWLRFYSGNIQNAEKFAKQKNLEIANKALFFLQFNYLGDIP